MKDYLSLGTGQPATPQVIQELCELLGAGVLLVPVEYGQKRPILKDWPRLPIQKMQEEEYLRQLEDHNIGVVLGRTSGGLVTIDFEDRKSVV